MPSPSVSGLSLTSKTWIWDHTGYNDGTVIKPKKANAFTLKFNADGTFTATTDCNSVSGKVATNSYEISFTNMISTKMFCEGSQERDFQKTLEQAAGHLFTEKGELILDLKFDSGTATFK
jgi:heat shock protein HslJ